MNINEDYIFVWLSSIAGFNYLLYIRLLKLYGSCIQLFYNTKNREKLKKDLENEGIFLSNQLLDMLTSENLKKDSFFIYKFLLSKNIKIVSINSKKYPKKLFNLFIPPLCILLNRDIDFEKNKCIYLHYDNDFSIYGKNIYVDVSMYLRNKKVYKIGLKEVNSDIVVKSIDFKEIEKISKIKNEEKNYIFVISNANYNFFELEILAGLIDLCIIPEFAYEKKPYIKYLIDILANDSKDILVAPRKYLFKV